MASAVNARTAIVELRSVNKTFPVRKSWGEILRHPFRKDRTPVLNDITLDVFDGEFFGLLGRNGAGKTTLFRILSTLVLPDSGSVTIDGLDAVESSLPVRSIVAPVIASERSLHWRLDARENLRLYAALLRIDPREIREAIERVLRVVALQDVGLKMVGDFSSGMRQRLLIARALLARPRVLLLDEPTRSLDPISARDFRTFLRQEIVLAQKCTVILATHDAEDVWNLCDRVAVLDRGTLLAVDDTSALRSSVGDEVYRIWVREEMRRDHDSIAARMGIAVLASRPTSEAGWAEVSVGMPGQSEQSASFLAELTRSGIPVARLEKSAPTLADLIERVVQATGRAA